MAGEGEAVVVVDLLEGHLVDDYVRAGGQLCLGKKEGGGGKGGK